MGVPIHIIHPTGFTFSDKHLRRAGMDYAQSAEIIEHASFEAFEAWRATSKQRLMLLTTKATQSLYKAAFKPTDIIMLGRESAGVPAAVAERADQTLLIPMQPEMRSLNVAISGALALGEALRQTDGFAPK